MVTLYPPLSTTGGVYILYYNDKKPLPIVAS